MKLVKDNGVIQNLRGGQLIYFKIDLDIKGTGITY